MPSTSCSRIHRASTAIERHSTVVMPSAIIALRISSRVTWPPSATRSTLGGCGGDELRYGRRLRFAPPRAGLVLPQSRRWPRALPRSEQVDRPIPPTARRPRPHGSRRRPRHHLTARACAPFAPRAPPQSGCAAPTSAEARIGRPSRLGRATDRPPIGVYRSVYLLLSLISYRDRPARGRRSDWPSPCLVAPVSSSFSAF